MKNKDLPKGTTHYVDNKRFQVLMVERKALVDSVLCEFYNLNFNDPKLKDWNLRRDLIRECTDIPKISEEVGEILLEISTNLQYHYHFIRCPDETKDGMVFTGLENCIKYFDNYNSDEYDNPFAYFTQICYWAFLRYKQKDMKKTKDHFEYRDMIMADSEEFNDKWDFQNSVVDDFYKDPNPPPEPEAEGDDN